MQKTEYMVFAGRQYFLGDKCQVKHNISCGHADSMLGLSPAHCVVTVEGFGERRNVR